MIHATQFDAVASLRRFEPLDAARLERLNAFHREIVRLVGEPDATMERYGEAAGSREDALCCPVEYDAESLAHIPRAVLDIDYGCGDPTVFAETGQTVLDLGSGSGKHCFMIARKVGPTGRVIGIDKTPRMLHVARSHRDEVMRNLGYAEAIVDFRHGHIENLQVDMDLLLDHLQARSIEGYDDLQELEAKIKTAPLVADESVDLVVSNCVLNLVDDRHKRDLLREIFRVVRKGGSVAISDIVADRPIPEHLKQDAGLWSGCLSGAFVREEFFRAFEAAGFHGICEQKSYFWKRVEGINFFSITVRAWKGKQGPCYETYRNALYKGPFKTVRDDDGHVYERGQWAPVCEKTAELLSRAPYAPAFSVTPALEDPAHKLPFDCGPGHATRDDLPALQRQRLDELMDAGECCTEEGCC